MESKGRVVIQPVSGKKYFLYTPAANHPPTGGANKGKDMAENQESEPLLDDDDYALLRCDSLLARVDSNNFASLLDNSTPPIVENEELNPQEIPPPPQDQPQTQQQEAADIQLIINSALSMETGILQSSELSWDHTENWQNLEDVTLDTTTQGTQVLQCDTPVGPCDGNSHTSFIPDSSPNSHVPSLQSWPGQYEFKISLPIGNKDRNKWCYSMLQNKVYLCPLIAVPIHVKLLQWFDASITITPVFKESRHRVEAVMPCFNCKNKVNSDVADHLVMVEGQECMYKQVNERYVVSVPLHPPPPGEVTSTLLVKLSCLQSCIGGPNRRPFCLVFTLHDSSGNVVGRQVLDLKCCRCPSRDMLNEDKAEQKRQRPSQPINDFHQLDRVQALKRSAAPVATTGEKKKRFNIKMEPGTENRYRSVTVPVEFVGKVKTYINSLIAEDYIRRNQPNILLFSEDEL
uniref:p53 DNA-binding domain-containing protein n=1 Tax=Scylla olivacea TaxID=85551 RepID=A0A0P4WEW8_SCYOL